MIKITIDRAIKQLKQYRDNLNEKNKRMLERLSNIGVRIADVKFSTAQYDGTNDVKTGVEWVDDKTISVYAQGSSVTFIEFGAGVHYSQQHPYGADLGFIRGEFGEGKGSYDSWGYYGEAGTNGRVVKNRSGQSVVITHGNPPARAMYDAEKYMRQRILNIAKEVYSSDR